jgi:hypothetical protein
MVMHARLPRGNGAGPAAVDSQQRGLASMACLSAHSQPTNGTARPSYDGSARNPCVLVRPTASLSYSEGSIVEPPSTVQETRV